MSRLEREHLSLRAHLIGMLALFAALFLGLTIYLYVTSRSLFADALQQELSGDLEWMASTVHDRPDLLIDAVRADSLCKAVSKFKGFRVTFIDSSGRVIADSHVPLAEIGEQENHGNRPEVRMAMEKGWGLPGGIPTPWAGACST